jgi:tetraacyldisaccharide 4'-kinase
MSRRRLESTLTGIWFCPGPPALILRPLAALFGFLSSLRRVLYRHRILPVRHPGVPVVIVGNIAVGGSGKTPFTIWLARALAARGIRCGIVTRGYGGHSRLWPQDVTPQSSAASVGDEALLLARETGCPVIAAPDRAAAATRLREHNDVQLILSDDGLQHYALGRDFEIALVDGARGLGNGCLLPAGPLREPPRRLDEVDCVVVKRGDGYRRADAIDMTLELGAAQRLGSGETRALAAFTGAPVHAAAGIADPEQFFAALRARGLEVIAHPFPDHAPLTAADLQFDDDLAVLMTAKDAIKLPPLDTANLWVVPAGVRVADSDAEALLTRIAALVS